MSGYNKVIMVGNLTRDPQLSALPSGTNVCEFGLAVNRKWKADGKDGEDVCFIDCRLYGKQAETFNQYMAKGREVLVEGRLQLDVWEGKDGQKRSKHRINVQSFTFMGKKADQPPEMPAQTNQPQPPPEAPTGEDIPF